QKALAASEFSGGEKTVKTKLESLGFTLTALDGKIVIPAAQRDPPWSRDELILALDLYFRHKPAGTSDKHPDAIALSEVLNALPIHTARPDPTHFRNPNSVVMKLSMKLSNFQRLDPAYAGHGLPRGNKIEEVVWKEFAGDRT